MSKSAGGQGSIGGSSSLAAPRTVPVGTGFSLRATAAPVWWGRGRWPNVHWADDRLWWIGREGDTSLGSGEAPPFWRSARQVAPDLLELSGTAPLAGDRAWCARVLGIDAEIPSVADPVVASIAQAWPGMRPFAGGSLWEGLLSSIAGQSVSVVSGAATLSRVAALFHAGVELGGRPMWPLPSPAAVAAVDPDALRQTGLTWGRTHAMIEVARWFLGREAVATPGDDQENQTRRDLLAIRGIGPWTVDSALLWGVGATDVYPSGDVALLRAARRAYERPAMTMRDLDALAEGWAPNRAWAARFLWLDLLGPAP